MGVQDYPNISKPAVTKAWGSVWSCFVPSSEWMFWAPLTSIKHPFVTAGPLIEMLETLSIFLGTTIIHRTTI